FLARLVKQLHAQADAEHRLPETRDDGRQSRTFEACHGVRRGADARQYDVRSTFDLRGLGGQGGGTAEPFQRNLQRGDVGAAGVHDHRVAHRTPLVLGSASPSSRTAWRSARPKDLKQASTRWWVFSPRASTW